MRTNHALPSRILLCRWAAVLALAGVQVGAQATVVSKSEFQAFMDLSTGTQASHTVGFGSNGTPLVTTGTGGVSAVGNVNFAHDNNVGTPYAKGNAAFGSPVGKSAVGAFKQPFSAASVGRAVGKFSSKVFFPLTVGVALYDLAKDLGFTLGQDADGNTTYMQDVSFSDCDTSGFGQGQYSSTTYAQFSDFSVHTGAACSAQTLSGGAVSTCTPFARYNGAPATSCTMGVTGTIRNASGAIISGPTDVVWATKALLSTKQRVSKTEADFEAAMPTTWPSTSKIDEVLAQAVNAGQTVDTVGNAQPTTITPTQVASTPKTTTNSDGSSVTSTTKCDSVVNPGTWLIEWRCWTESTTATPAKTEQQTVVITNPDGTTSTQVITKTTPAGTSTSTTTAVNPDEAQPPTDICAKDPTIFACAHIDVPTGTVPKSSKTITYTPESVLGAGSCPADKYMTTHDGRTIKVWDWTASCDKIVTFVKPVILAAATFIALLIIMPIRTEI